MKSTLITCLFISLGAAASLAQSQLTVQVTGFKTDQGLCKIWLFRSAEGFPTTDKKAFSCVEVPIKALTSQYRFDQLPLGHYAVSVVHDQNGNHQLDSNLFHIPKEAYGISNDARGSVSGPPTFEKARLLVSIDAITVPINVH